jgi:ferredoxin
MESVMIVIVALLVLIALAVAVLWLFGERWHVVLPSTRRMMRQSKAEGGNGRLPGTKKPSRSGILALLEGYAYGRWTNQYISVLINRIVPRLTPEGRKKLADHYHGKVLTHDQAKAIIQLDHRIRRDLEQIVPYPIARDFILNAPPEIAAYECACRHARANPCQPTQVCMVIGEGPVSFVLDHNPHSSRRLTQAEALQLLKEEHDRGHLHSAWFKDVMGDRFYAICNCCKCCCGGIEQMNKFRMPTVASSGFVANIDPDLCNACGECEKVCPFEALHVNGSATRDWEKCMGCGVCVDKCATEAIALVRDEKKGIPLDVRQLV